MLKQQGPSEQIASNTVLLKIDVSRQKKLKY